MTVNNLQKGDRVTVHVVGKQRFTSKLMYEVDYQGQRLMVPMFKFQYDLPLPETMECLVGQVDERSLYLKQNLSNLIKERYRKGETYEFVVEQDFTTTSTPHYKVSDGSGFYFKLRPTPGIRLAKNSKVRCRITRIKGTDVTLECVGAIHEMVAGFKIETLMQRIGADALTLIRFFNTLPGTDDIRELYNDGNPEWINAAAELLLGHLGSLSKTDDLAADPTQVAEALSRTLVWFLEDSGYFDKFNDQQRRAWQTRFISLLARTRALQEAFAVVTRGEQQRLVDSIFSKIAASGYLIDAPFKLRTLRNVFALDPDALSAQIARVLDTVVERSADIRTDSSFRRAFAELLQLYIDNNCRQFDEMDRAETNAAREGLDVMIRVIAMQLLLADSDADAEPTDGDAPTATSDSLNRPRLYRYLTLRDNSGNDAILRKAMQALLACEKWHNEYSWREMGEIITLTSRLRQEASCATLPALYETPGATISASLSGVEIVQAGAAATLRRVYPAADTPAADTPWNFLSIDLGSALPPALRSPRTIPQYKRFWAEVETRLTSENQTTADDSGSDGAKTAPLLLPERGQQVEIEVTGIHPEVAGRFLCRVVENGLAGEGWIDTKEISGSDRDLPYQVFVDTSGRSRVYPATVLHTGDGNGRNIGFSMLETLENFHNRFINFDATERCVILNKRGESCMTLSENGYIVNVEIDANHDYMERGDLMEVTHITTTGTWREGEFVRPVAGRLDYVNIMTQLMSDFAFDDETAADPDTDTMADDDEVPDEQVQEANRLSIDQVREIARIIESVGANEPRNDAAYNYFSYARLMARLIGDNALADYFTKRCTLLEELDDFFTNGHVDLQRLEVMMPELMKENNSLSTDVVKLRILSVIDHNENNHLLWDLFGTDANESLQELARLVLAYNMLDGFKMRDERFRIRQKLYSRLKMSIDREPEVIAGGMENLHTEFKTSIVYPANSMRLDAPEQTKVILKVIASFLNTEGGTLYIGVSDEGYVRGLDNDLAFFGRRDSFDRYVHDNMRKKMTFIPNLYNYVATEWVENGGKDIYKVTVRPIAEPVAVEGVYYYREGSSCVMVRSEQEESFMAARRALASERPAFEAAAVTAPALPDSSARPASAEPTRTIATSRLRNNVLHDGFPGYEPVEAYLYVHPDLTLTQCSDDRWLEEACCATLSLHAADMNREIAIVSADGYAQRLELRHIGENGQRISAKLNPVFITPMSADDRLIMIYRDSAGAMFKRIFEFDEIRNVRPGERGELLARDIAEVLFCEIVPPEARQAFKSLTRKQRIGKEQAQYDRERQNIGKQLGIS